MAIFQQFASAFPLRIHSACHATSISGSDGCDSCYCAKSFDQSPCTIQRHRSSPAADAGVTQRGTSVRHDGHRKVACGWLSAADGTLYTKERFLKLVGDKNNPLELFEYSEMEIHTYGTTAVVFSRLHEKGFMDGKPYELNGRPTWTWVKRERAWVCVAAHD